MIQNSGKIVENPVKLQNTMTITTSAWTLKLVDSLTRTTIIFAYYQNFLILATTIIN